MSAVRIIRYVNNNGIAKISVENPFGGVTHMEMKVTLSELNKWIQSGQNIQDALPHLTPDEREFLISGITPEQWEEGHVEGMGE